MIIAKFGGSSVANKDSAQNIKKIVTQNQNIKFVVVSAIGKSEKYQQKVTDLLYKTYFLYKTNQDYSNILDYIFDRYINLAKELNLSINFDKEKQKIIGCLMAKTASKEYIVSRGEYLSAKLYAKLLHGEFLDACDYIIFKSNNEINFYQTVKRLKKLPKDKLYVIGGFYGASNNGQIRLFDRGGSDITGAVLAKVLNAEIYQNYTDVDGVYDKNPNIFNNASSLPILSYKTAYGMADAGNEVVHKTALKLLKDSNTVLIVKNTFGKEFGTVVTSADYILKNLFVCKIKVKVLKFFTLNQDQRNMLCMLGRLKLLVKHGVYFYALYEEIHVENKQIFALQNLLDFFDGVLFTLFGNVKINQKYIKKISKIDKKSRKIAIFASFLAKNNRYKVLVKDNDGTELIKIINKYV